MQTNTAPEQILPQRGGVDQVAIMGNGYGTVLRFDQKGLGVANGR